MGEKADGVPVIWLHTILGEAEPSELEDYFKGLGYTVEFQEEFEDNEGGRHIIFNILDNVGKFCMFRLQTNDLKWLEDYAYNYHETIPEWVVMKYNLKEEWEDGKENN